MYSRPALTTEASVVVPPEGKRRRSGRLQGPQCRMRKYCEREGQSLLWRFRIARFCSRPCPSVAPACRSGALRLGGLSDKCQVAPRFAWSCRVQLELLTTCFARMISASLSLRLVNWVADWREASGTSSKSTRAGGPGLASADRGQPDLSVLRFALL